ncbi:MAG: hypothetical protein WBN81_05755 [Gammaproteobacteria bacterium]
MVKGSGPAQVVACIPLATALRQQRVPVGFVRSASTCVWLRLRPH